ncbi:FAD-dependent oxidoreductase [Acidiphilium sp. PA]|uniref:FAD-dependent oxidoreductase n=1 Tax=Acidiphilium sp. PA TaxID=2871705 RepID=UPI002244E25C|nr:FAD-dependent oxidoreductase [Acidiphilium sp. PA]MCW8307984.1 FAD-dependent oxidoreductase [Acidiphilium sp. PA]
MDGVTRQAYPVDPKSAVGKLPRPAQFVDVLVVGAGPAGIAAALAAAGEGRSVMLVDEHPVSAAMAGLDVPYLFGGRATPALGNQARMIEQIAGAMPGLDDAFEAGIEVALNTSIWGMWVAGPGLQVLPCAVAGLATEDRSWLCGFGRAVIATGARDLVLSFAGSDQPGVLGAQALHALLTRYDAFAGRVVSILGSGRLALETALRALDKGLTVAALIEVCDAPQGPAELVAEVAARGVAIRCGAVPLMAETNVDGVVALRIIPVAGGTVERIACDTVCLALGLVPQIELLDTLGAPITLDRDRGGYVPVCDATGQTPIDAIRVAGDCAGVAEPGGLDYRMTWMRALLDTGGNDALACTCEEVTRGDVFALHQPRYLGPESEAMAARDLAGLLADGPPDHDQMKRLTRVSMGPCQGRRCREQVAMLLAIGARDDIGIVNRAGFRAPVRPLSLAALAAPDDEAGRDGWDVWFGIVAQWVPYDEIGTPREADYIAGDMHL